MRCRPADTYTILPVKPTPPFRGAARMPIPIDQSSSETHGSFLLRRTVELSTRYLNEAWKEMTMVHLIALDSEKAARAERQAKLLRDDVLAKCKAALQGVGDDLAGFALVVWDKNGEMQTAYDASRGPVGPALLPTLASDALNRHVAVMLARDDVAEDSDAS
jgi:hypothetical protein